MKKSLIILTLLSIHFAAQSATQNFAPSSSKIEFEAIGRPSMMKVKGSGAGASGQLKIENNEVSGTLKVPLKDLKTGIDLRDEHMKDKYLHVKKHPEAVLTLDPLKVPADWKPGKTLESKFTGKLKLHGEEKPVEGDFSINQKNQVTAKFEIKLTDFKIDIPSYLGVTIADKVKVKADFALVEK